MYSSHRSIQLEARAFAPVFLVTITLIAAFAASPAVRAEGDWPQFRGPGARGVAEGENLPLVWGWDGASEESADGERPERNIVWSAEVPGSGWGSPIVVGDLVFLTTAVSRGAEPEVKKGLYFGGNQSTPSPHLHRYQALAFDAAGGELVWVRTLHTARPDRPRHIKNNHAPETAASDGERVFAYFTDVGIFALSLDGQLLWERRFGSHRSRYDWGGAASPIAHEGRVYLVNDNEDESFLVALDARTGETVWRVDRDEKSNWSTPYVWKTPLRSEIVLPGTGRTRSYSLDGEELWSVGGFSSITIATPYAVEGLLYLSSGYVGDSKRPIYALREGSEDRPAPSGELEVPPDGAAPEESPFAWVQHTAAPYNPSTVVYEGILYVLHDFGFFAAYDAKTGEEIYGKQRFRTMRTPFTASPWAYRGRVFCLSEDGDTFVVRAGREFEVERVNAIDELSLATPAIAHESLYVRTARRLLRIAESGESRVETAPESGESASAPPSSPPSESESESESDSAR